MGGFDRDLRCELLDQLCSESTTFDTINTEYIINGDILQHYRSLNLRFDLNSWLEQNHINDFAGLDTHDSIKFRNFICSFNGSPHVGRKLLTSCLHRFGWFNPQCTSKNFAIDLGALDGHIIEISGERESITRKFFSFDHAFLSSEVGFQYDRFDHRANLGALQKILTSSFVHLVSETMPTSYYPFLTEKFLYSVVTRGMFVAYAQPGWHEYLSTYLGFKKFSLFDYSFDQVKNPIERLITLMCMLSRYSVLSVCDWHDLYLTQAETIEYNYDHYRSGRYLQILTNLTR